MKKSPSNSKISWEEYCNQEIALLKPILASFGLTIDSEQPHISGERFLMHAVTTTSGKKIILIGKHANGDKVVIKATKDKAGIEELIHERTCRDVLKKLDFAGEVFHTPEEVAYIEKNEYVITIQRFISQPCSFLERPLTEQFSLALQAFKGQESAHATTFKHRKLIGKTFGIRNKNVYLNTFLMFEQSIKNANLDIPNLTETLSQARTILVQNQEIIEQYSGFLTHTDFVPHNIRVSADGTIYLLDHSSLTFGNKYEGWARFINFMTLYNGALQRALETYVHDNRAPEEATSLRMMRIYRLGEILFYYMRTLPKSEGDLLTLNTARIHFWKEVLSSVLHNQEVSHETIHSYTAVRDALRTEDERRRQQGLH